MNAVLLNNNIEDYDNDDLEYKIENWNTDTLHNAILTNFKDYDLKSLKLNLQSKSLNFIAILSQLHSINTFKFIKFIDQNLPGMTVHFIMDVRHEYKYNDTIEQIENLLFLFRLSYYLICFPEQQIVMPFRKRLCSALVFEFVESTLFLEFQEKMHSLNNNLSIESLEKKQTKKNLYLQYFQLYMTKMTEQVYIKQS